MKKTILTIAASALFALSAVQLAAASEHYRGKTHHRTANTEFRDSHAYALPTYEAAQPEWYRYSGGYSDLAGH
jgi:hypothetical protein